MMTGVKIAPMMTGVKIAPVMTGVKIALDAFDGTPYRQTAERSRARSHE